MHVRVIIQEEHLGDSLTPLAISSLWAPIINQTGVELVLMTSRGRSDSLTAQAEAVMELCGYGGLLGDKDGPEVVYTSDDSQQLCELGLFHLSHGVQRAQQSPFTKQFHGMRFSRSTMAFRCDAVTSADDIAQELARSAFYVAASPDLAVYRYHVLSDIAVRGKAAMAAMVPRCYDVATDLGFHGWCHHSELSPCDPLRMPRNWTVGVDDYFRELFEFNEITHPFLISPYIMTTHRPAMHAALNRVSAVLSAAGESCVAACKKEDMPCVEEALPSLNTCTALSAYLTCSGCEYASGDPSGLPGITSGGNKCMVSQLRRAVTCAASSPNILRLCTCDSTGKASKRSAIDPRALLPLGNVTVVNTGDAISSPLSSPPDSVLKKIRSNPKGQGRHAGKA